VIVMAKFLDFDELQYSLSAFWNAVKTALGNKISKSFLVDAGNSTFQQGVVTNGEVWGNQSTATLRLYYTNPVTGARSFNTVNFPLVSGGSLGGTAGILTSAQFGTYQGLVTALPAEISRAQGEESRIEGLIPATPGAIGAQPAGDYELAENKVEISAQASETQYPTAKSVWDLVQDILAEVPAGGLSVPLSIDLESQLPGDLSGVQIGAYWYIQNMNVTANDHTGRAWVNNDGPGGVKIIHTVIDQYQHMDGDSIVQTGSGAWQVSGTWMDSVLAAKGYVLSSDLGSLAVKNSIETGDISNGAVTLAKLAATLQTTINGKADYTAPTSGALAGLTLTQAMQYISELLGGSHKDLTIDVNAVKVVVP
jgi:hypothetical protein